MFTLKKDNNIFMLQHYSIKMKQICSQINKLKKYKIH